MCGQAPLPEGGRVDGVSICQISWSFSMGPERLCSSQRVILLIFVYAEASTIGGGSAHDHFLPQYIPISHHLTPFHSVTDGSRYSTATAARGITGYADMLLQVKPPWKAPRPSSCGSQHQRGHAKAPRGAETHSLMVTAHKASRGQKALVGGVVHWRLN